MRKIIASFSFFFLFAILFSHSASAQSLTLTPLSGNSSTTFTVSGSGYDGSGITRYNACLYDSGGKLTLSIKANFAGPSFSYTFPGSIPASWGGTQFEVRIKSGGTTCDTANTVVTRQSLSVVSVVPPSGSGPFSVRTVGCPGGEGINTAIGCIPTEAGPFVGFFLKYILGLAGLVAFFLIIIAGFQILTSAGNPEKLEGAKQLLTAAIVGAIFIIFSVVLLQIINTNILGGLPGFPSFFGRS